ncbi:ribonuclease E [Parvularcula bermudensis HTCC2503]|uniref:Ribonuclease E n=1 Tax=Parvularcula bermudensis (strain ATCC BAA-594 / HTCC2503 / KCTC 12087) TaxID=314260 RepID=E0TDU5_PARBH|nr:Rne/Rng family ribonuclease [Parvularcula bermudensis]ADM10011.1 ribonuclease E [Parvularcula bermudensis HTCC2503]
MTKKMMIDARHPEETRVAVLSNGKVEDFDFESLSRKPLRGNIYLARVTRVEPSLQAAFIEYGGNRHGFLAFGEIHSDYYQIPVADREVLRAAEALEAELAAKLADFDQAGVVDIEDEGDVVDTQGDLESEDGTSSTSAADDDDGDSGDDGNRSSGRGRRRRRGRRRGRGASKADGSHAANDEDGEGSAGSSADEAKKADTADEPAQTQDSPSSEKTTASTADQAEGEAAAAPAPQDDQGDRAEATNETGSQEETGNKSVPLSAKTDSSVTAPLPDDAENEAGSADITDGLADSEVLSDEALADAEKSDPPLADDGNAPRAEKTDQPVADGESAPSDDEESAAEEPKGKANDTAPSPASEQAQIAALQKRYDEARRERDRLLRNYRIQEVIKRRQVMLVQVVKEERGNKGAALTTFLSLAGRYGVLMPNNARGGGVSRKISNQSDRRRLRKAMAELNVPAGQGLIIRTAGAKRTKAEIKRDYDYLARLWDTIRSQTLQSVAPCLIYEEASLIKRAIRDLYDKDTAEILVEGEDGYREAKDFMKMLMPSHAKNVQPYREQEPLFLHYGVERQLDEMYQPVVTLKSGGYLVIQQTEALISIDVNSGKSTKERNVEATALKTNSEAAVEVARQCRLRDLAGLIVVDFIDMDENRNNRTVEKKFKEALKSDRARIQVGSISTFGLLEMSRQRRRSGIVDGTTRTCPTCDGAGAVRSVEMAALRILRAIEEKAASDKAASVTASAALDVSLYILNQKRDWLNQIEATYGCRITVEGDSDKNGDQYELTVSGRLKEEETLRQGSSAAAVDASSLLENDEQQDDGDTPKEAAASDSDDPEQKSQKADDETAEGGDGKPKKRRRRRRKRNADSAETKGETESRAPSQPTENETKDEQIEAGAAEPNAGSVKDQSPQQGAAEEQAGTQVDGQTAAKDKDSEAAPKPARRRRKPAQPAAETDSGPSDTEKDSPSPQQAAPRAKATETADQEAGQSSPPKTDAPADKAQPSEPPRAAETIHAPLEDSAQGEDKPAPKRGGWWQRAFGNKT